MPPLKSPRHDVPHLQPPPAIATTSNSTTLHEHSIIQYSSPNTFASPGLLPKAAEMEAAVAAAAAVVVVVVVVVVLNLMTTNYARTTYGTLLTTTIEAITHVDLTQHLQGGFDPTKR